MRISLLEKRENFFKILKKSLKSYTKDLNLSTTDSSFFIVNKYLNFISSVYLPSNMFNILVNEYSNSNIKWKRIIQFIYVRIAVKRLLRLIFAHKIIRLPNYFSDFLILGGNHRLRLFSSELKGSLVILKSKERDKFISNDVFLRENFNLSFAPKLLEKGNGWFIEEYFEGNPVNRLVNDNYNQGQLLDFYQKELIEPSKNIMTFVDYKNLINLEIEAILRIDFNSNLYDLIVKTFVSLFSLINLNKLEISWTHGDLQEANILKKDNEVKIIDWESADRRFYLYDYFTLSTNIRSTKSLEDSINIFAHKYKSDINVIYLLLVEELRFSINENFSLNFFSSGKATEKLCSDILTYINE